MTPLLFKSLLLSILISGILCASLWAEVSVDPTTVTLERPVHFFAPDGTDVLVPEGTYRVEAVAQSLQLYAKDGNAQLIAAEAAPQEEEVNVPLAVSLSGDKEEFKDLHLLILLLPGGQSLEAAGSYSGIRERGLLIKQIRNFKRKAQPKIAQATRPMRIGPAIKTLWPVGLVGLWMNDPSVAQIRTVKNPGGKWYWPGHYDLYPKLVHLTWRILPVLTAKIPNIIAKQGFGFALRLNGKLLQQGPNALSGDFYATPINDGGDYSGCPQNITCFGTTILKTQWVSVTPPWNVELTYWQKVKKSSGEQPKKFKMSAVIYPNQTTAQSYFTHSLYPIFQHERCKSCHALGSKTELVQRHNGIISEGIIQDVQGLLGMNLGCGGGCHTMIKEATQPVSGVVFHDSEWKTPRFDMGIDWRGKTTDYICQKVTSSLTTPQMLRDHFFHDARIAWAVHSGLIPPPVGGRLSKAPPGDYYQFKNLIEAWIRADVPCPKINTKIHLR